MDSKLVFRFLLVTFLLSTSIRSFALQYGPLELYSQAPLQVNALTTQLRSGFSLPINTKEIGVSGTASSVWANTPEYSADYYQNQLFVGSKWQVNDDWQVALNYRWNVAADNKLDHLTVAFHDLLGISQNGRNQVDKDRFYLSYPEYDESEQGFEGETLSSAITGYAQYQLFTTTHHGLSFGASVYYNDINHSIFSNTRFEQAIQLNYSYRRNHHHLDMLAGLSFHHPQGHWRRFPYKDTSGAFGLSYQYNITPHHDFIAEYHAFEGISYGANDFSSPSNEIVVGYRYKLTSSAIELSMIENIFNMNNSSDIAFTLAYRLRFN
ncbi:DUF3187 family protein [Vibrio sp.]|nr:DUF3187 family protein [Vibrio sp.]